MFFLKRKASALDIEFVSVLPGLEQIDDCRPYKSSKFTPAWWGEIPNISGSPTSANVRSCPSFASYFSSGYILPMWADTIIKYDPAGGRWSWNCGRPEMSNPFLIDIHGNSQMIDYVTPNFLGIPGSMIFKFVCPWQLITPKGYSVLQLPLFYEFDNDFSVLPGIIDTDRHHQINLQVLYHGKGEEVFIPRGTPLAQFIPIKREKMNLIRRYKTAEDEKIFGEQYMKIMTLFLNKKAYRKSRNVNQ